MATRAGVYIDGFNMYHALDALAKPHLKWVDIASLGRSLLGPDEILARAVMCTAVRTDNVGKMLRHRAYLSALEATGVECLKGHFADEYGDCRKCGHEWVRPVEKQGDLNLGLAVLDDAYRDEIDRAYLVTVDGDQAATVTFFRKRFPDKTIISVAPPGRIHNKKLLGLCHGRGNIAPDDLQLHLLPKTIQTATGLIVRPADYDP